MFKNKQTKYLTTELLFPVVWLIFLYVISCLAEIYDIL